MHVNNQSSSALARETPSKKNLKIHETNLKEQARARQVTRNPASRDPDPISRLDT
jgi:hypothetical protein